MYYIISGLHLEGALPPTGLFFWKVKINVRYLPPLAKFSVCSSVYIIHMYKYLFLSCINLYIHILMHISMLQYVVMYGQHLQNIMWGQGVRCGATVESTHYRRIKASGITVQCIHHSRINAWDHSTVHSPQ